MAPKTNSGPRRGQPRRRLLLSIFDDPERLRPLIAALETSQPEGPLPVPFDRVPQDALHPSVFCDRVFRMPPPLQPFRGPAVWEWRRWRIEDMILQGALLARWRQQQAVIKGGPACLREWPQGMGRLGWEMVEGVLHNRDRARADAADPYVQLTDEYMAAHYRLPADVATRRNVTWQPIVQAYLDRAGGGSGPGSGSGPGLPAMDRARAAAAGCEVTPEAERVVTQYHAELAAAMAAYDQRVPVAALPAPAQVGAKRKGQHKKKKKTKRQRHEREEREQWVKEAAERRTRQEEQRSARARRHQRWEAVADEAAAAAAAEQGQG